MISYNLLICFCRSSDSEKQTIYGPNMKYPLHTSHPSIPGTPNIVRHNPSDMIEDMATDNPLWIDQLVQPKYARPNRRATNRSRTKNISATSTLSLSNFHFGPSRSHNFNTFSPKKLLIQKKYFLPTYRPSNASSMYRSTLSRTCRTGSSATRFLYARNNRSRYDIDF